MADTAIAITAGSGTNVDTRTEATNGNHRQVVVLGDPSTNAGVAPVDATAGLKVDLGADNDVTVTGTVTANAGTGTMAVSAASLPLPSGAATAAKQPALGTAGTPSADVITVQGAMGVTPLSTVAQGTVAHDSADADYPVKIGAKAKSALSGVTLVAADDRTDLFADLDGAQIVRENCAIGDYTGGGAAITDGSSTSVIAAQGSGIKTYITDVVIANSSASFVTVDLRDGAAGTVKATFPVPATGGVVFSFKTPLAFSANTAVCADPSAAASTISVSLGGFKSKI